jgi:hypothetical protein
LREVWQPVIALATGHTNVLRLFLVVGIAACKKREGRSVILCCRHALQSHLSRRARAVPLGLTVCSILGNGNWYFTNNGFRNLCVWEGCQVANGSTLFARDQSEYIYLLTNTRGIMVSAVRTCGKSVIWADGPASPADDWSCSPRTRCSPQ